MADELGVRSAAAKSAKAELNPITAQAEGEDIQGWCGAHSRSGRPARRRLALASVRLSPVLTCARRPPDSCSPWLWLWLWPWPWPCPCDAVHLQCRPPSPPSRVRPDSDTAMGSRVIQAAGATTKEDGRLKSQRMLTGLGKTHTKHLGKRRCAPRPQPPPGTAVEAQPLVHKACAPEL